MLRARVAPRLDGGTAMAGKNSKKTGSGGQDARPQRLPRKIYEKELFRLQAELVKLQEWVRSEGARVVVIFEGRDAAGKGSTIKRVTEYLNPRIARIAALPAPTNASGRSGSCSATSSTCQPAARSSCSTAAGTTGPVSSTSWASAQRRSTTGSCTSARSLSGCSSRTASCCASTGSR